MASTNDFTVQALREAISNQLLGTAALAIGSTAANIANGACAFKSDGVFKSLSSNAAGTALALPTGYKPGYYVQPDGTTVYYSVGITAGGTIYVFQGDYAGRQYTDETGLPRTATVANLPTLPTGYYNKGTTTVSGVAPGGWVPLSLTLLGVMKVVTSGAAFTPATTALTSIATFTQCDQLPSTLP